MWAFGHTHFKCGFEDKLDGETGTETSTGARTKRDVANQRGYYLLPEYGFNAGRCLRLESKIGPCLTISLKLHAHITHASSLDHIPTVRNRRRMTVGRSATY
jgi:hypothetical protein